MGSGGKKKKNTQTLSLSEFQAMSFSDAGDSSSWIDANPLPSAASILPTAPSGSQISSPSAYRTESTVSVDMSKLPSSPPYTAYIGNLPFDIEKDDIVRAFPNCLIVTVKLVRDKIDDKLKGHGYIEFENLESLKVALKMNGSLELKGRKIKIDISESSGRSSSSSSSSKGYMSRTSTNSFEISRRTDPVESYSPSYGKSSFKSHGSSSSLSHVRSEIEITRRTEPVNDLNISRPRPSFKASDFPDISRRSSEVAEGSEPAERSFKAHVIPEITRRKDPIYDHESTHVSSKQSEPRSGFKTKPKFSFDSSSDSWRSS